MSIAIACPACGWTGKAQDALAGKRVKCPQCSASFRVGGLADAAGPPSAASPSPAPAPPITAHGRLTPPEAAALVSGPIAPVRTTLAYRLALALVGVMMILLPAVYLAMIAAVGWGVWWHLVHNVGLLASREFRGKAAIVPLLLYAAPAVIGALLVLFMVKPFLARRQQKAAPRSLRPEDEPTLFALVASVCRAVGAPMPKRIDVDLNANASASYRRGLLSVMGDDLVLTLGLPLVAGLTVDQLAGVLAHEFGHFTQGAGMGFGALINRINSWFARVVWQRDAWDARLEAWSKSLDLRIVWIIWAAWGCVWVTRRMLLGLMWVAHALSCHLSRQMEYDADLHQTRLVGGAVVAETFQRLPRLALAEAKAWQTLESSWLEGMLADSVPDLMMILSEQLTSDENQAIATSVGAQRADLFATHPAVGERIRRAAAERSTPVLACREPAARLFSDFPRLCRELTRAVYERSLPGAVADHHLRPPAEVIARHRGEGLAVDAASRWLEHETSPHLPFPGTGGPLDAPAARCLEALREVHARLAATPTVPREGWDEVFDPLFQHQHSFLVATVVALKQRYHDKTRGISLATPAEVEEYRERTWADFTTRALPLTERRQLIDRRLRAALGWLAAADATPRLPDVDDRTADVTRLTRALAAMAACQAGFTELVGRNAALGFWLGDVADRELDGASRQMLVTLVAGVAADVNGIRATLLAEPYPLDHADHAMTIGRYLVPEPVPSDQPDAVSRAAGRVQSLFPYLAWQLVGRLILHAEAAEAVALAPASPAAQPPLRAAPR